MIDLALSVFRLFYPRTLPYSDQPIHKRITTDAQLALYRVEVVVMASEQIHELPTHLWRVIDSSGHHPRSLPFSSAASDSRDGYRSPVGCIWGYAAALSAAGLM